MSYKIYYTLLFLVIGLVSGVLVSGWTNSESFPNPGHPAEEIGPGVFYSEGSGPHVWLFPGRVGVNTTTTPSEALRIVGDVFATGRVCTPDGCIGDTVGGSGLVMPVCSTGQILVWRDSWVCEDVGSASGGSPLKVEQVIANIRGSNNNPPRGINQFVVGEEFPDAVIFGTGSISGTLVDGIKCNENEGWIVTGCWLSNSETSNSATVFDADIGYSTEFGCYSNDFRQLRPTSATTVITTSCIRITGDVTNVLPECLDNQILVRQGDSWVCEAKPTGGDNLGNHIATQDLNLNSNRIINVANPTNPTDGVNKRYVDGILPVCSNNQVLKYNVNSATWVCANDINTNAQTICGNNHFLRGDGTCVTADQIVSAGQGGVEEHPIACSGSCTGGFNSRCTATCSASCLAGFAITSWSCGSADRTISGRTGSCSRRSNLGMGASVSGSGTCKKT